MRIAVFDTKPYDRRALERANQDHRHDLSFFEPRLTPDTVSLAEGFEAVCLFVQDRVDREVVERLAEEGLRLLLLRSAGFDHVDLEAAQEHGVTVARVPAYSPHAVAEHALALILTLNRKLHRAYNRVREWNLSLEGLMGFDMPTRTVGVIGTGKIGTTFCRLLTGFGCRIVAYDPYPNDEVREMGVEYLELDELWPAADVLSLHTPLTPDTHHLVDAEALEKMKDGVMIINTSRGAIVDTEAVVEGLKSQKVGSLGLDVYEEEGDLFFEDLSETVIQDDVFARLLTFPNVLITSHQGFFTREALDAIARTTLGNATAFETGEGELHEVGPEAVKGG